VLAPEQRTDGELALVRAVIIAEIDGPGARSAPSLRPPTLNTQQPLREPSVALAARLSARAEAGFSLEGHDYPRSRTWSRVVVPAIAVGSLDLIVVAGAGIAAAFHVYLAWLITILSAIVFVALGVVAGAAAISANRDPLRLSTAERRELNLGRSWQSSQPWMGPRSATPEHRLLLAARDTVQRLAGSRTWASRYLDDHRIRLDLLQELDGIDRQACQLAHLRAGLAGEQQATLAQAWDALLDRVARLRIYADGVTALDEHVARLDAAARAAQLEQQVGQLAVGSALDQFAAEQVRALSADLHYLSVTNFASSRENGT
jgi:hypothetical protein